MALRMLALAILAVMAIASLASAQNTTQVVLVTPVTPSAGGPDLEVIAPAAPLPAKARTNAFFEVTNLGPGGAHDVSIVIQPAAGDLVVVGQSERSLDDIAENDSGLLVVRVATPAQAGSGTLTLTFSFTDDSGTHRTLTRSVTIQISPPVSPPLEVSYAGAALEPGKPANLSLVLSNPSSRDITNLDVVVKQQTESLSLTSTANQIQPGADSSRVIHGATLPAHATTSVDVPVVTSLHAPDVLPFSVTATYDLLGFEQDQTFEFGARTQGTVQIRVLQANEVRNGNALEIAGTVVNTGTGTAYNPRISPAPGSGLVATAPVLIEDLKPNDAVDFRIPVTRATQATPGAPLVALDWNDDQGAVHQADVQGQLVPAPPPAPSWLARQWARLLTPLGLVLVMALALVIAAAVVLRRMILHRREEREEEEERRAELEGHAKKPPPQGKQRPKPG